MTNPPDLITVVKRIAKAWKINTAVVKNHPTTEAAKLSEHLMLAYRNVLEMCGLTLNEIISLGNAPNLDKAVDELFSNQSK